MGVASSHSLVTSGARVGRRASLNSALPGGKFAMHLMYFTEQPMSAYDSKAGLDFGATALMFSNKHFDPTEGSRLYNEYLEHYILADELGIDGIMLNEHHNAPFCMRAKTNIFASILAGATKNTDIVILGNP